MNKVESWHTLVTRVTWQPMMGMVGVIKLGGRALAMTWGAQLKCLRCTSPGHIGTAAVMAAPLAALILQHCRATTAGAPGGGRAGLR